ncbi:MAG: hypothetical protein ABL997_09235 [Planctomycetota bacterium]
MNRLALIVACSLFAFTACTSETKPAEKTPAPITPEVIAKLALADQKDGAVDKVVHQCAGCSLSMPGEDKLPLKVQDYTMHFCKQECLDKFKVDPAVAINALTIKN